jgi:hypothetical protein
MSVPSQVEKVTSVPRELHMAAYEVYEVLHGRQEALTEGWCRGGFGTRELLAYLYARPFPRAEWKARFQEAFAGLEVGR